MRVWTIAQPTQRCWVTNGDAGTAYTACGEKHYTTSAPPVEVPSALVDCPRCAKQLEAFELATLSTQQPMAIDAGWDL